MPKPPHAPDPILVIMGPTASGKSSLAIEVARLVDGEIVSADAFAVYRGLDIGTDKPKPEARREIPHHLVDIRDVDAGFSAGEFITCADAVISDIRKRGKTPIVAGGTHFYIHALLHGLFASPPRDPALRAELETAWARDPQSVFSRLFAADPDAARQIGPNDRQRLLRALEVFEVTRIPISTHWKTHEKALRYQALLTAPQRPRPDLYARINERVDLMFAAGFVDEVDRIMSSGVPAESRALKAIGYREVVDFLSHRCTLEEAAERTKKSSRKYAKRQISWLHHRLKGVVHWVAPAENGGASQISILWADHVQKNRPKSASSSFQGNDTP